MRINICVYNLGTGATAYGDIYDREDWIELEKKVNPLGWNDVETQVMDSDLSSPITDDNIWEFMRLVDMFPKEDPNKISDLLNYIGYEDTRTVLENDLPILYVYADSKVAAFMEYYEELGYEMPPAEWADFIDWELKLEDFDNNGLQVEKIGFDPKRLISKYIVVQTY